MYKIYVAISDYDRNALDLLNTKNVEVTVREEGPRPKEEELIKLVKDYDVIVIGAKEKMTKKVYDNAEKLKIIGTLSIGLDHISENFLVDSKVQVINCPDSNVSSTAEHTFALILTLSKKILHSHKATCDLTGRGGIKGFPNDLYGKTIGIIGCGRIGQYVMKLANAFNMKILCTTQNPSKHDITKKAFPEMVFVDLNNLLSSSDIITIHVPLTESTKKMLGQNNLKLLKKSSYLINTSRLQVVDHKVLVDLLQNGMIKGYGVDLDVEEKSVIDNLSKLENVVMTPHTAGVSIDSMIRMDMDLAKQLINHV